MIIKLIDIFPFKLLAVQEYSPVYDTSIPGVDDRVPLSCSVTLSGRDGEQEKPALVDGVTSATSLLTKAPISTFTIKKLITIKLQNVIYICTLCS